MMFRGGESQRSNMRFSLGYSAKAQCTGKPSYSKPNPWNTSKTAFSNQTTPYSTVSSRGINQFQPQKQKTTPKQALHKRGEGVGQREQHQFPEVLENRLTKNFLISSATTTTTANDNKNTQSPTPSAVVPKNSCINGT